MGLMLRYQLFRDTTAAAVYGAYVSFYTKRGRLLQPAGMDFERIDFHHEENGWVVVDLDGGWEWKERREAQLLVSRQLCCAGFLVFVYDGDYWGYEFFDQGEVLDHFVQESTDAPIGFAMGDCRGNPAMLAARLPPLRAEDIAPYLVQKHAWAKPDGMDRPARASDQYRRFDECAVLDFLRMLGVRVGVQDEYVRLPTPIFRSAYKHKDPELRS